MPRYSKVRADGCFSGCVLKNHSWEWHISLVVGRWGSWSVNLLSYFLNASMAMSPHLTYPNYLVSRSAVPWGPTAALRPVPWSVAMPREFQHVFWWGWGGHQQTMKRSVWSPQSLGLVSSLPFGFIKLLYDGTKKGTQCLSPVSWGGDGLLSSSESCTSFQSYFLYHFFLTVWLTACHQAAAPSNNAWILCMHSDEDPLPAPVRPNKSNIANLGPTKCKTP